MVSNHVKTLLKHYGPHYGSPYVTTLLIIDVIVINNM